jgi:hypothetical protein
MREEGEEQETHLGLLDSPRDVLALLILLPLRVPLSRVETKRERL